MSAVEAFVDGLSDEQRDGLACCVCGESRGALLPVGIETAESAQLFICEDCTLPDGVERALAWGLVREDGVQS